MKYEVEITKAAEQDIEEIFTYISEKLYNSTSAMRMVELLDKNIKALADSPEGYPLVKDDYLRSIGIRFIPIKNYIVFYTFDKTQSKVCVVRVLYGKRNWKEILNG